ncbi:MAG: GTP-binding protein [Prosthecobacter sp.]|nr:GTP-binding protein [Prosthecobacter sp.]
MRVTVLSGFLGSGKTTLLRRLLRDAPAHLRLAVLVNDLSDLEVDGDLIRDSQRLSEAEGTLISLYSGTLSGGRRVAFREALATLAARSDIDHLLIETSGGNAPAPLLEDILATKRLQLQSFLTLIDTRAFAEDYQCGLGLLSALEAGDASGQGSAENLLVEQIIAASSIILTKTERLTPETVAIICRTLEVINPNAIMLTAIYGKTEADLLAPASGYDPHRSLREQFGRDGSDSREAPAMGHTILRDPRPFHPQRLWDHVRERLPQSLHRSKGFIWLASRPEQVLLWNQSAGSIELELLAYWKAALVDDPEKRLLPEEIQLLRARLREAHPVFGDRLNELTLIGPAAERAAFAEGLRNCLCTDSEVARWQKGGTFDDPWPRTLRQV